MIPRDIRYTVTSLPMQAGNVPAGAPTPSPTPVVALENVPSTMTAGTPATAQVRNTGTVPAAWSSTAGSGFSIAPNSGTLAPGATQALALSTAIAGPYSLSVTVAGGSATGSPANIVVGETVTPPTLSLTALGGLSVLTGAPLNFGVVLANPGALPLVGTPENVAGTAVFSPAAVSWSLGDLNKAFAATWAAAGTKSIRVTAPGGLVSNTLNVTVINPPPPPPPTPTLATLSGSASATAGVAHVDTVTLDVAADQVYTVTWSRSDSATGPATSTIAIGQTTAVGSSTWPAAGSGRTVDFTISPALTRAGRPLTVTVAAAPATAPTMATLSGSSTASTGVAHTDTVTLNTAADQTYTITWTRSNGGTGTATSTISAGQTSVSASTTWAAAGSGRTVDFTISPAIARAGNPLSVTVSTTAPPPSTGTPQPFTLTSSQTGTLPFALGYAMTQGHVPSGQSLSFAGATAKLTVLSTWPDGSARHGIIAGTYTSAGGAVTVTPTVATVTAGTALTGAAVQTAMGANTAVFDAGAFGSATFSGADFASPFKVHAATDGFIEAIYRKAVGSDAHLVAWLALRVWSSGQVEALPWIENGYIRVTGPTNKSATYKFTLGGVEKFNAAIDLPHHTRTPLVSGAALSHWLGTDPGVVVKHDAAYLMATKLVPTYSATVSPSAAAVTGLVSTYTPLQVGNFTATMGVAGYQPTIGLLPQWDVLYLTSTASSVWAALQRNGYSAGRWGIHYRDENTNRPLKFSDFPNLSTNSSSTSDYPPSTSGTAPGDWDIPHHPSVGYMAYLVTGRWFHMETVLFAATNNYLFQVNTIRQTLQGIFRPSSGASTLRGAAWCLRTLAQAATVIPDSDTALKAEFVASLEANVAANYAQYIAQPNNPYGFVETYGDNSSGSDGIWTTAMWQQDFFTAVAGYMVSLQPPMSSDNRAKAAAFFQWKAKSIVGRLSPASNTNGWLYRDAACYTGTLALTDTPNWVNGTGPWPATWRAMYDSTFDGGQNPAPGSFADGDLRGSSSSAPNTAAGYWANLVPAIAYAVEHDVPGAADGYLRMTSATSWATIASAFNTDCVWSVRPTVLPVALPAFVPSSGSINNINLNTLDSVNACPTNTCWYSQSTKNAAPWRTWNGAAFASGFSQFGAMCYWGGGHSGGEDSGIYTFDLTTRLWSRIGPTMPTTDYTASLDTSWMDSLVSGNYLVPAVHTYGFQSYLEPGIGGTGPKGAWMLPLTVFGSSPTSSPHNVDLATGVWTRGTTTTRAADAGEVYAGSFRDSVRKRTFWGEMGVSTLKWIDETEAAPRTLRTLSVASFSFGGYYSRHVYVPEADQTIGLWLRYGDSTPLRGEVFNHVTGVPVHAGSIDANLPSVSIFNWQGSAGPGFGFDWCPDTQAFYIMEGPGVTRVLKLTPSTLNFATCSWTITTITTPAFAIEPGSGISGGPGAGSQPFSRWRYIKALKSFVWSDGPSTSGVCVDGVTRTGLFQLWRVPGA